MNQITLEKKHEIHCPVPLYSTTCYQQNSNDRRFASLQGRPPDFLLRETQNQPSVTCMQAPQAPSNIFPLYGTMHYGMPHYPMGYQSGLNIFHWNGTQNPGPTEQTLTVSQGAPEDTSETGINQCETFSADNMPDCQIHDSSSSSLQGEAGASTHSSQNPVEDALQKREIRLRKNREAARLCRRKKKEYVSCLELRVAALEKQNRCLIEELRALRGNFLHKVL